MYKLVVLDIDGTTLNDAEKVTKENFDAIQASIKKGVPVCLCTGRNIHNTKRVVKHLKLDTPYVCVDGTTIYDTKKDKYIKNDSIDRDVLKEMIEEIEKEHLYIELCTDNNYVKYVKTKDLEKYVYAGVPNNISKKYRDYFLRGSRYVKTINNFEKWLDEGRQLIFAGEKKSVDKVKQIIIDKNYKDLEIKDDLWPNYVFISKKNCRKINGVEALCEYYNIELSEVITMGDQMNDFDMIKGAGLGIAMGNAHEKIKEVAKFTTLDNNNSGVAHAINKFVLNK